MSQAKIWGGEFGDQYTDRNRVDWLRRISFWTEIVALTGIQSALEVGCNAGWNLLALRMVNPRLELYGIDVNERALSQARNLRFNAKNDTAKKRFGRDLKFGARYDLVFTAGCLIHISQKDIEAEMRAIKGLSNRYILAVEYDAPEATQIIYRGDAECWKRPYGFMYSHMGLKIIADGEATKDQGFDNCHWWLMEKGISK